MSGLGKAREDKCSGILPTSSERAGKVREKVAAAIRRQYWRKEGKDLCKSMGRHLLLLLIRPVRALAVQRLERP